MLDGRGETLVNFLFLEFHSSIPERIQNLLNAGWIGAQPGAITLQFAGSGDAERISLQYFPRK